MDLGAAGLAHQPFPTHGKPSVFVSYRAQRAAREMLESTYSNPTGLSLLQAPALSGKSTIVRSFVDSLHEDCAVAIVDGKGLNTANLLLSILRQFGYDVELSSNNELLGLVRVFAQQQASFHEPPLLLVENAHELGASAFGTLCKLADLRVRMGSAIKIVLVSDLPLAPAIKSPALQSLSRRLVDDFHLRPMSQQETRNYLHEKLRDAGSACPEFVFPEAVCTELWKASGGWPGILDRLALLAIARAETLPVPADVVERPALPTGTWDEEELALAEREFAFSPGAPHLTVTNQGSVIGEMRMDKPRLLIGRSEHNDISISSHFISRHHALLVRNGAATFLMDLNSTNGTFVNAKRVSNHVLVHDDVITIGHHKIKFHDPDARARGKLEGVEFADTAIMKTLQDMRKLLAQENTELMPAASEDLPTIQT